jgi:hypothetical protein
MFVLLTTHTSVKDVEVRGVENEVLKVTQEGKFGG